MSPHRTRGPALTAATSTDELDQLRAALRGTLGTADDGVAPALPAPWREGWSALAELGVTGFCVPEQRGGFGMHVAAAAATAGELGTALHGSPFAGVTAAAHALSLSDDATASDLVPRVLTGEVVCGFGRLGPAAGTAALVDGATDLDAVVLARADGEGLLLFPSPDRWELSPAGPSLDVSRSHAAMGVDPARGIPLAAGRASELFDLLIAADALGTVRRSLDRTVAYAGQHVAFGRPIGGFQAVQHRLADHAVHVRGTTLLLDEAARHLADDDPAAARSVALASLGVHRAATHVLHDLLQLTGGIGFTWEYGLHLHQRRAHQDACLVRGPRSAVGALARIEGWADGA